MRKTTFMSLMAVTMFIMAAPTQLSAKKIKFGENVVYNGKVENGLPKGEGKLIVVNKDKNQLGTIV